MKKVLLSILLLLIIAGGIFYRQLLATINFYTYQHDHATTFTEAVITWKQIPFTSAGSHGLADKSLRFGSLQFPVPFAASITEGADATIALGGAKSITIMRSSAAADFFTTYDFSTEDKRAACDLLSRTSGRGACTTNYDFFRAFLTLQQKDVNLFGSLTDKTMLNRLLPIRAKLFPHTTIAGFETSRVRGFLFITNSGNYTAEIFNQQDQQYTLTFTNLEQADVMFTLSNITQQN